jgi:hypothetical protein
MKERRVFVEKESEKEERYKNSERWKAYSDNKSTLYGL